MACELNKVVGEEGAKEDVEGWGDFVQDLYVCVYTQQCRYVGKCRDVRGWDDLQVWMSWLE